MHATVHRLPMRDPGDVSALAELIERRDIDPQRIVAVLGKTEGNGLVNDYTRGYLTQSLKLLLGEHAGRPLYIFSGGTEGVLSPHYVVFSVLPHSVAPHPAGKALAIGCAMTRELRREEIGSRVQADLVSQAVTEAIGAAGIDANEDVRFVQVKGPCTTPESMAYSRVAGAFGVGMALGDIDGGFSEKDFLSDRSLCCNRASVSCGVEVRVNEVMVLGNSAAWSGPLSIASRPMQDALDLDAVLGVLADLGLERTPADLARIRAAMVKGEPDTTGRIRGHRHTMLVDGDMNAQRHIRGALGGLAAGVLGDGRIFVSGGAEHQGPAGGGLVAAIASS